MSEQSRLERIDPASAIGEVKPIFDAFIAERGKVPNLYRVVAHSPRITPKLAALQTAVMGKGAVDMLLKELLSTRVSHINLCDY